MDELDKKLESLMEKLDDRKVDSSIEKKVSRLIEESGCTFQQASAMMDFTAGNINQALEIINAHKKKNTIIVKARFKAEGIKYYGMIFMILDSNREILEKLEVAIANDKRLCQFDESASWENFERVVYGLQLKEGIVPRFTGILKHRIKEIFRSKNKKTQFFQALKEGSYDLFKEWLKEEVANVINDNNLELKADINLISTLEPESKIKSGKEEREEPRIVQKVEREKKEAYLALEVALAVSPLTGILVSELRKGDRVIVKIIDNREVGRYIATLMGGRKENQIIPLVAYVEEVIPVSNHEVKVLVNLGPGIKGEAPENIEVKVILASSFEKLKDNKDYTLIIYKILSFALLIGFFIIIIYILLFSINK
ncbi:hypothetical protein KJ849_01105 [bacterium]|nr:hypothetical protein [bacterium]